MLILWLAMLQLLLCPIDSSDEEVTKVLQTFLQSSTLGDFSLRLHLLRAFCHTPLSKQQKHALNTCSTDSTCIIQTLHKMALDRVYVCMYVGVHAL